MRIRELFEATPTIADVIKTAAQPTAPQKPGSSSVPPPPGTTTQQTKAPAGTQAPAPGTTPTSSAPGTSSSTNLGNQQPVDLTKIPPAQIQQHLRPGTQVNIGTLGKIKVGQVTANGVEFDGTNTPIGSKFTVDFKTLQQQTPQ